MLAAIVIFLYGIIIGSFLNVCIYRLPAHEDIVREHSHCMSCGYRLAWYDLIPVVSYVALRGKCRNCGAKISPQYPLIELMNGILWVLTYMRYGITIETLLYALLSSALIVLAVIDYRTYEIPVGINYYIGVLGLVRLLTDLPHWQDYLIGALTVSTLLYVLYLLSHGAAIGGGDIKLMAAAGLLLGWQKAILAFVLACILGSIIHTIRMKAAGAPRQLAMGPYLAIAIYLTALYGENMITWYLTLLF